MITYLLRNIDRELWAQFSERATSEGRTLRGVLLLLVQQYVRHGIQADATTTRRKGGR